MCIQNLCYAAGSAYTRPLAASQKIKIRLLVLLLIVPLITFGQAEIPFEQIAFDFYKETILKEYPSKKVITLLTNLEKEHVFLWFPQCLQTSS